jgi:hypothetical protein
MIGVMIIPDMPMPRQGGKSTFPLRRSIVRTHPSPSRAQPLEGKPCPSFNSFFRLPGRLQCGLEMCAVRSAPRRGGDRIDSRMLCEIV